MIDVAPTAVHRDDASRPYVTVDTGVELKVLQVRIREGLWVIRNRFQPGARVQTHKYTGTVFAFTTRGAWKYLESADVNVAGSYLYESAGTLVRTRSSVIAGITKTPLVFRRAA